MDIADDVFGPVTDQPDCSNEHLMVVAASDADSAAEALRRAGLRFCAVTEVGEELRAGATTDDDYYDDDSVYTPNLVSEVRMAERGPWMYVDCKASIPEPMRTTMVRILAEELAFAGVTAGSVVVPSEDELDWTSPGLFEPHVELPPPATLEEILASPVFDHGPPIKIAYLAATGRADDGWYRGFSAGCSPVVNSVLDRWWNSRSPTLTTDRSHDSRCGGPARPMRPLTEPKAGCSVSEAESGRCRTTCRDFTGRDHHRRSVRRRRWPRGMTPRVDRAGRVLRLVNAGQPRVGPKMRANDGGFGLVTLLVDP